MPTTDLLLLLDAVGLDPAEAGRVSVMPLGYVLGYLAGWRQAQWERAPWCQPPGAWTEWRWRVALVTEAVRLVQDEYDREAAEKGEQQR